MSRYTEFCMLRDYRAPGADVCKHTESEAFALATLSGDTGTPALSTVHALISDDQYASTFQTLSQYRKAIKQFITHHQLKEKQ